MINIVLLDDILSTNDDVMRVLSNYKKLVEGITTSDDSSLGKSSLLSIW